MIRYVFAALVATAVPAGLPTAAMAATEGHRHKEGEKGPHGGVMQDIAGYEAELVMEGNKVTLYLIDHATNKAVQTDGMKASVLLVQGTTRKGTITLNPAGDKLEGTGEVPAGSDAVISLRLANGKSGQARFELGGHAH